MPDPEIVQEAGSLSDVLVSGRKSCFLETGSLSDAALVYVINMLTETGDLSDSLVLGLSEIVSESGDLADSTVPLGQLLAIITETGKLSGFVAPVQTAYLTEAGDLADYLVPTRSYVISEAGDLADATVPVRTFNAVLIETGDLSDYVIPFRSDTVAESGDLADFILSGRASFLVESGDLSDESVPLRHPSVVVIETADISDAVVPFLLSGLATIMESGFVQDYLDDSAPGAAWTSTTDTFAASQFDQYPYTGIAMVNGKVILLGGDGLYVEHGTDDNGAAFAAKARTDSLKLANELTRMGYLYAGYDSNGYIAAEVTDYETGAARQASYNFETRNAAAFAKSRAKLSRRYKSARWAFAIKNVSGSSYVLHDLVLVFDKTSRGV